jgi:hypothetical protein
MGDLPNTMEIEMEKIILSFAALATLASVGHADPKWVVDRNRALEMHASLTTESITSLPAAKLTQGKNDGCVHRHPTGRWCPNVISTDDVTNIISQR